MRKFFRYYFSITYKVINIFSQKYKSFIWRAFFVKGSPLVLRGAKIFLDTSCNVSIEQNSVVGKYVSIECKKHYISKRKANIEIGENCVIKNKAIISCQSGNVSIGDNSALGRSAEIICHNADVKIGCWVRIAAGTILITNSHSYDDIELPIFQQPFVHKSIKIEDDVWIGRNVIILPGITIGKGSIVAAGAVVTKNIPSYSIFGGLPAKLIRKRNG